MIYDDFKAELAPFFPKPQFWAHFSLEIVISQEILKVNI